MTSKYLSVCLPYYSIYACTVDYNVVLRISVLLHLKICSNTAKNWIGTFILYQIHKTHKPLMLFIDKARNMKQKEVSIENNNTSAPPPPSIREQTESIGIDTETPLYNYAPL